MPAVAMAASISPLVTRPSLPVAATEAGFTPVSAEIRATAGPLAGAETGTTGAAATTFGASATVAPAAPAVIEPRRAPTPTVSPSFATISAKTPAAGALTSNVTLSVSSSSKGSSASTASPGFLNHLPMVASVTDSPRVGTRISVAMWVVSLPCGFKRSN